MRKECKHAKDQCVKQLNATHQANQVEETSLGDEATYESSIQRPKGNENVTRLGGGACSTSNFQRVLEHSRILQNAPEPSGIY